MAGPKLYRKRIIPSECIFLKDDIVLYRDDDKIITQWKTLRPKKEFTHGFSCYFLNRGYKVSKFLKADGNLLYWYCDIIDHEYQEAEDTYVFRDLLADVLVYPDDFVKVDDLDEFEEAISSGALSINDVTKALKSLSALLDVIYEGKFPLLTREIDNVIR